VGQEHGPVDLEQFEQITAGGSTKSHPAYLWQRTAVQWAMRVCFTLVNRVACPSGALPSASGVGMAVVCVADRLACIQRELFEKAHGLLVLFCAELKVSS